MAKLTKEQLKNRLDEVIYENTNRKITEVKMNELLTDFIDSTQSEEQAEELLLKEFTLYKGLSLDTGKISNKINKYFLDSVQNSAHYNRAVYRITENTNVIAEMQFENQGVLSQWLFDNLTEDDNRLAYDVTIKVFINLQYPEIGNIWAYNNGYGILKGHSNLHNHKVVVNPALDVSFLQQMVSINRNIGGDFPDVTITNPNILWFQNTQKTLYNLPKFNGSDSADMRPFSIKLIGGVHKSGRWEIYKKGLSGGGHSFEEGEVSTDYDYVYTVSDDTVIVRVNDNHTLDVVQSKANRHSIRALKSDNLVAVMHLKMSDWHHAFLVKPVGMDTFDIRDSNIDHAKHRLFGYFYDVSNNNPFIRVIKGSSINPNEDIKYSVRKAKIVDYMLPRDYSGYGFKENPANMRKCKLFYMDEFGNASKLSRPIYLKLLDRGATLKMMM